MLSLRINFAPLQKKMDLQAFYSGIYSLDLSDINISTVARLLCALIEERAFSDCHKILRNLSPSYAEDLELHHELLLKVAQANRAARGGKISRGINDRSFGDAVAGKRIALVWTPLLPVRCRGRKLTRMILWFE